MADVFNCKSNELKTDSWDKFRTSPRLMCVRYVSTAPQNIGISYSSDPFHIVSKPFAILSNGKSLTSNISRASYPFKVAKSFTAPRGIPKRYQQFSVEAKSWRFCDNCYNFLFIFQDLLSKSIVTDLEVFVINPVGITNSKSFLVAVRCIKPSYWVWVAVLDRVPRTCCHGCQGNKVYTPLNVMTVPTPVWNNKNKRPCRD